MAPRPIYDFLAPLYPVVEPFLVGPRRILAREVASHPDPGPILEIGAGRGGLAGLLPGPDLVGLDPSLGMLRRTRLPSEGHHHLVQGDGLHLPFADGTFVGCVLAYVVSVVPDRTRLLSEAARVLAPGGRLWILNHFTPTGPVGWLDRLWKFPARLVGLEAVFQREALSLPPGLDLLSDRPLGPFAYFRLLSLEKR